MVCYPGFPTTRQSQTDKRPIIDHTCRPMTRKLNSHCIPVHGRDIIIIYLGHTLLIHFSGKITYYHSRFRQIFYMRPLVAEYQIGSHRLASQNPISLFVHFQRGMRSNPCHIAIINYYIVEKHKKSTPPIRSQCPSSVDVPPRAAERWGFRVFHTYVVVR
jgi:hypothetical protein